jgi:putative RNA 2'-phosphotransferase
MTSLYNNKSKFLSLILRHDPAKIGIVLDQNGWADVEELCKKMPITLDILKKIVYTDSKGRYSFSSEDCKMIRANQGHSIDVDVELVEKQPPDVLYHGTAEKFVNSIMADGLSPMTRQYVHLSSDKNTALVVGKRHGDPVVLIVDAENAFKNGNKFFLSKNNVWLTKMVNKLYIMGNMVSSEML